MSNIIDKTTIDSDGDILLNYTGVANITPDVVTLGRKYNSLNLKNGSSQALTLIVNGATNTIQPYAKMTYTNEFDQFTISSGVNSCEYNILARFDYTAVEVPNVKQRVGKRISILNTQWASQAVNWSNVGAPSSTMVFNPGYATVSGGDGALTQCHVYTPYKTVSKRTKIRVKTQCVNGSTAGQYGLFVHLLSANVNNKCSFQAQVNVEPADATTGRITFYLNQTLANKNNGSAKLPPTNAGDMFEITITSDNTAVYVKYNNLTQGAIISHVFRWDNQAYNPTNIFQVGFSCFGGAWNIYELECTDNEVVRPDLLFIGDSLSSGVTGVSNMKTGKDFPAIIASRFPNYSISRWCGGGDAVTLYIEQMLLDELLLRKPKYAFILMGLNDMGLFARSLGQLQADYTTLVAALKASGTIVIHGGLIPNNARDTRPFNSWVKSTYINDLNIDMFSPLAEVGICPIVSGSAEFTLNAFWLADANTHMNEAGNFRAADVITMWLIENGIFNASQMLNITPA